MLKTDLNLTAEIKLYYDLFVPENLEKLAPLLLAVHGYGAHKRYMMREARLIAPENFVIASIQAPFQHYRQTDDGYKVGFGWLTDYKPDESILVHHNFALDLVEKLAKDELIDEKQIYLFGFSQACSLNFRFALANPERVRGVIGVCGGIPSDLDTNANYQKLNAEVLYLYDDADEFYPLEKFQNFEKKLKEILPSFQSKCYEAKHEITNEMRKDMRVWLTRQNAWAKRKWI
ncbi:MAG: dienelactone hydrolase family protein [Acidobacteriota bacterium]|nr:dienelactone hydrolase family protein [Acidobacteriota bacterium]